MSEKTVKRKSFLERHHITPHVIPASQDGGGIPSYSFDTVRKNLGIDPHNKEDENNSGKNSGDINYYMGNKELTLHASRIVDKLEKIALESQDRQFNEIWELIRLLSSELNYVIQANFNRDLIHVMAISHANEKGDVRTIVQAQLTTGGCNFKKRRLLYRM